MAFIRERHPGQIHGRAERDTDKQIDRQTETETEREERRRKEGEVARG